MQDRHIISKYFAPRGTKRMYELGMQLGQLYLAPDDKLIGVIGDAGSGKSSLIRGMFPGLELTNDDNGVYVRPLPILDLVGFGGGFGGMGGFGGFGGMDSFGDMGGFSGGLSGFHMAEPHTYHLDIRFENGFTSMQELAHAIQTAIRKGKRVVVEHFDLVFPLLGINADLLIGVGEEVVLSRPTVFGPEPQHIVAMVYKSLPFRLMSHTAEDLCEMLLPPEDLERCEHDDVMNGFVLTFRERPPQIDLRELEKKMFEMIEQDLPVTYKDENHVTIGPYTHYCTGPRTHVSRTGQIKDFHLLYHFLHDRKNKKYMLVGCLGEKNLERLRALDKRIEEGHVIF